MTPQAAVRAAIRTPDQRLRVFVSSTLKELAPERKAARAAIERLAAAPVMFELGARPHPPRDLYRAYLEQSDIFVGIYGERYGWVAPGETVSGLEDEYDLAPAAMPRLIYIRETAEPREPRLMQLLDRIRTDDRASFKYFGAVEELGDLLVTDLAVLLAERFDQSRAPGPPPTASPLPAAEPEREPAASLPAPLTQLVGREGELEGAVRRLRSPSVRLLTLLGPGGIGKTRLAIELARRLDPEFPDGARFVPLASVERAPLVANAIVQALGLRDPGDQSDEERLVVALRRRAMLLVLDNFEQVTDAAPLLPALLEAAPDLKILVTSRALLKVAGEHSLEVQPLGLPAARTGSWDPEAPRASSVELFVERARAVKPDFELTAENIDAVEAISSRLEGVPLAIELAAARLRLLAPAALLERLDRQLALLVGGQRNLPPRQQAVRSTIEWSTRLLSPEEQDLLWRLGVFSGRFSLEAVESLAADSDVLLLLEALVDGSLIRQQDRRGRTFFLLLGTVHEYALEQLEARGRLEETRGRHAQHYLELARSAGASILGPAQAEQVAALAEERDNLRAAARLLLDRSDFDAVAELIWSILPYWWMDGLLSEVHGWTQAILAAPHPLPDRTRAIALSFGYAAFFWHHAGPEVISGLAEAADLFERAGYPSDAGTALVSLGWALVTGPAPDPDRASRLLEHGLRLFRETGNRWGQSVLLVPYARLAMLRGDNATAVARLQEGLRLGAEAHDYLAQSMALTNLGYARLQGGAIEEAAAAMDRVLRDAIAAGHDQGVAWGLEAFGGIAALGGDAERAGLLIGAAEAVWERMGLPERAEDIAAILDPIVAGEHGPLFEDAVRRGRRMPMAAAIELAGVARDAAMPAEAKTG